MIVVRAAIHSLFATRPQFECRVRCESAKQLSARLKNQQDLHGGCPFRFQPPAPYMAPNGGLWRIGKHLVRLDTKRSSIDKNCSERLRVFWGKTQRVYANCRARFVAGLSAGIDFPSIAANPIPAHRQLGVCGFGAVSPGLRGIANRHHRSDGTLSHRKPRLLKGTLFRAIRPSESIGNLARVQNMFWLDDRSVESQVWQRLSRPLQVSGCRPRLGHGQSGSRVSAKQKPEQFLDWDPLPMLISDFEPGTAGYEMETALVRSP